MEVRRRREGRLYAALRVDGLLSISGWTHERMGEPDGYVLLFDRARNAIGLKPARMGVTRNAYRVRRKYKGTNRNRTIFARPLCEEFGIAVEKTIVFRTCAIDRDGVLVLRLDQIRE